MFKPQYFCVFEFLINTKYHPMDINNQVLKWMYFPASLNP